MNDLRTYEYNGTTIREGLPWCYMKGGEKGTILHAKEHGSRIQYLCSSGKWVVLNNGFYFIPGTSYRIHPDDLKPKQEEDKFGVGKQYKTRDGRKARVICVDRNNSFPIVALHQDSPDEEESVVVHTRDGMAERNGHGDLIAEWTEDTPEPIFIDSLSPADKKEFRERMAELKSRPEGPANLPEGWKAYRMGKKRDGEVLFVDRDTRRYVIYVGDGYKGLTCQGYCDHDADFLDPTSPVVVIRDKKVKTKLRKYILFGPVEVQA